MSARTAEARPLTDDAQPSPWALVVETGADGMAFGPVLSMGPHDCLKCFTERRLASGSSVGVLSLQRLSHKEYDRVQDTRLCGHQIHTRGAQRFIPPAHCPRTCPTVQWHSMGTPLAVEECIGSRIGLVRRLDVLEVMPGLFTAIAIGARSIGSAGVPAVCSGTATSTERDYACRLALYEALERYAAAFWQPAHLLGRRASRGPWIRVNILGTAQRTRVEAARIFMPFRNNRGRWSGTSEGLACAASVDDALKRALAELIERRVLRELFNAPCPQADDMTIARTGAHTAIVAHVNGHFVTISLERSPSPPYLTAGFGCSTDLTAAIEKANRERLHVGAHHLLAQQGYWRTGPEPSSSLDMALERLAHDPTFADAFLARVSQTSERLRMVGMRETRHRAAVGWLDITPPDIVPFGLSVVRAIYL